MQIDYNKYFADGGASTPTMGGAVTDAGIQGSSIPDPYKAPDVPAAVDATAIPPNGSLSALPPAPIAPETPAAPAVEPANSIAEAIQKARAERAAREAAKTEKPPEQKPAEVKPSDVRKDPFGTIKGWKLSPEEQVELGRSLMFDIVPEKAPLDLRFKLTEAQLRREREEEKVAAEAAKVEAQKAQDAKIFNYFVQDMSDAASALPTVENQYPGLSDWFGDDAQTLTQSLIATGQNMAALAAQTGTRADLSPSAVMATLEKAVSERLARRDSRLAARAPKTPPTESVPQQSTGTTFSSSGMQSGAPRTTPLTDQERVARAIRAGWGG